MKFKILLEDFYYALNIPRPTEQTKLIYELIKLIEE